MSKTIVHTIVVFLLMDLSLAACGGLPADIGTASSSNSAAAASEPTATALPALCDNPLAPVKVGASWTYASTTGNDGPAIFSTTITDVRTDSFSAVADFGDNVKLDQEWSCTRDGLVAQSLGAGSPGLSMTIEGIKIDLATSNPTGLILPGTVTAGEKWPYGLDIAGTVQQGNSSANVNGTVSTTFEGAGTERVTVPAGTFDATKIQGTSTFKVTADYLILKIPITSTVTSTLWLAPNVGLVKSVESGDLMGTAFSSTTELQSFNIP